MTLLIMSLVVIGAGLYYLIMRKSTVIIPEDHNAVVVNRQGFIKRVLPSGSHHLKPGLEKVEFAFETKTKLAKGIVTDIPTAEGVLLTVHWSGTYSVDASLITERVSQRLRGLPKADKSLQRQVDVALRRLMGAHTLRDLFKPSIRERIERQLTASLKDKVQPSGIALNGLNLQAIIPPEEVLHALNQAQAIQTLDNAVRHSDAATREMIAGAHQLEDLIEWSKLFPPYGRYVLTKSSLPEPTTAG